MDIVEDEDIRDIDIVKGDQVAIEKKLIDIIFNSSYTAALNEDDNSMDIEKQNANTSTATATATTSSSEGKGNSNESTAMIGDIILHAINKLTSLYVIQKKGASISKLLNDLHPLFVHMPKTRTAKIVRTLIDKLGEIPNSIKEQISLCKESVEWCKLEKRTFLRQRIQTKLAGLLVDNGSNAEALQLLSELQMEVKRMDDKIVLVEIFLVESRAYHALLNRAKSKASLTAARSNATSTYVGPLLQAEIDLQGGILNAEEHDYRTAFSYLLEAFEGFHSLEDKRALISLKYMVITKILNGQGDEIPNLLSSKAAIKYHGIELEALRAVATAYKNRSLKEFDNVMEKYKENLLNDSFIKYHLAELHNSLLEKNLSRIIEPYSRVEISHVAKLIDLPVQKVQSILSAMILDKKFHGILDQGAGILIVFDDQHTDETYKSSLELIDNMEDVVDSLIRRSTKLT